MNPSPSSWTVPNEPRSIWNAIATVQDPWVGMTVSWAGTQEQTKSQLQVS